MSRFDYAAAAAEPGSRPVQGAAEPGEADHRLGADPAGQRRGGGVHRLPGALQHAPRPGQGRHPLRPERDARRSEGAGGVDDVEVRRGQHSVRRRQGRRDLRPAAHLQRRARAHHPPLHLRDHRDPGTRLRRAGAGREHQRAGDGVDHGHLLHAQAPHGHRRRHRQAGRDGRLAGPPRGDRPRLHDRHPRGAQEAGHAGRRDPRGGAGIRQRRLDRGAAHGGAGPDRRRGERQVGRDLQSRRASGSRSCSSTCGSIASSSEYKEAEQITNEQLLTLDCDVLVPAALENVITSQNAARHQGADHLRGRQRPDHRRAPTRSSRRRACSSSPTSWPTRAA